VSANEDFLRDKKLLIARERELMALRKRYDRLSSWHDLALRLPSLADSGADLEAACRTLAERVVITLNVQRVRFFHELSAPARLRSLGDDRPPEDSALGDSACALLATGPTGSCRNGDEPAARELSAAVGLERFLWLRSDYEGFWYPAVAVNDRVKAGQNLGFVKDYEGRVLQTANSPADGIVLFIVSSLAINRTDPLLAVGA